MNKAEREVQQAFLDSEKRTLKALEKNYEEALKDIDDKLAALLGRADDDSSSVVHQVNYQLQLRSQVENVLARLHENSFNTVDEYINNAYSEGFLGSMYDMQKQGVPLVVPINENQVRIAVNKNTKLSKPLYETMGQDVNNLSRTIASEITRGISTGLTYNEIARNIQNASNIPKSNAARIARTEAHRIQCQAGLDAQDRAKKKGADVVKQWDSTLDGLTRPTHRLLDGQIREIDDAFTVEGKTAMFPGDFGDPSEDCNCRCALLQRARWALEEDIPSTKWSADAPVVVSDDGVTKYVDLSDAKNFEEFKKNYNEVLEKPVKSSKLELPDTSNCKYATKEQYTAEKKSCKKNVSKEDVSQIMNHKKQDNSSGGYVATRNYSNINSNLRGDSFSLNKLDADDIETIEALRKAISGNTLNDDYILTRYVNADYLSSVFGIKGKNSQIIP